MVLQRILHRYLFKQLWCLLHGTKKLNLTIEFWNSLFIAYIFICLFVRSCFCLFTKLLEFICNTILAMKIKRYVHVSYMQLFDYLHIHNITYITHLHIRKNENVKPYYFSQHHKHLINYLCNLEQGMYYVKRSVQKLQ